MKKNKEIIGKSVILTLDDGDEVKGSVEKIEGKNLYFKPEKSKSVIKYNTDRIIDVQNLEA